MDPAPTDGTNRDHRILQWLTTFVDDPALDCTAARRLCFLWQGAGLLRLRRHAKRAQRDCQNDFG